MGGHIHAIILSLMEKFRQLYVICAKKNLSFLVYFVAVALATRLRTTSKKLNYHVFDGIGLYVPFYNGSYQVIREVFVEDIYKPLVECRKVLDIWAYIGDSALYLAANGAHVTAYEMNPDLYAVAMLNTYGHPNIRLYHGAVVAHNNKQMHMQRSHVFDNAWSTQDTAKSIAVPAYNIVDIITNNAFDGLKMDIEWGEYPIMEAIMANDLFPFERGIIELHNIQNADHSMLIDRFVDYLRKHNYTIRFFHNEDSKYAKEHPSMQWIKNLFFAKKI